MTRTPPCQTNERLSGACGNASRPAVITCLLYFADVFFSETLMFSPILTDDPLRRLAQ